MAIAKCKECGGQVSTSAKTCPHCGAKVRRKVGAIGWVFVLFVVLPIAWNYGEWLQKATSVEDKEFVSQDSAVSISEHGKSPAKPVEKWYRYEYKDQMTDEVIIVLKSRSLNSTVFDFPYQMPGGSYLTLNFRKHGNELDAFLSVDKGQMLCSYSDCYFNLRIGNGQVKKWAGLQSTTNNSEIMFVRDAKQLESIVKSGGKLRIGIDFYRAGIRAFDFDVGEYPGF
ncbi:hypothetical protein ACFOJE_21170 [Azotobacter bryophylli]|uniref:Zinc ribbon domain-containing protein n=1 Tax=Azotobacter bryophylli TaxID=1986537 RepID=A0ABV7B1V7_9GAMM